MSGERWIEVDRDIAAACRHFAAAATILAADDLMAADLAGYKAQMSLMHAMQAGHTSLENALLRILDLLGEEPPQGRTWHADLIRRVAAEMPGRPAMLPPEIAAAADETRRFRNVAVRAYDDFVEDRARPAVAAAALLAERLPRTIAAFRDTIDAPC